MSITKVRNSPDFEVTCDYGKAKDCAGELMADDCSFDEAVQAIRDAGWQIFKDTFGEWNHVCPACKEHKKDAAFQKLRDISA